MTYFLLDFANCLNTQLGNNNFVNRLLKINITRYCKHGKRSMLTTFFRILDYYQYWLLVFCPLLLLNFPSDSISIGNLYHELINYTVGEFLSKFSLNFPILNFISLFLVIPPCTQLNNYSLSLETPIMYPSSCHLTRLFIFSSCNLPS